MVQLPHTCAMCVSEGGLTTRCSGRSAALTQVTVDGVMQAPGGSEEDLRSGFTHGDWAMPFVDDALNIVETAGESVRDAAPPVAPASR